MALDRQSIEKKDFPVGRRGYDPEAVDAHLSALADEIADFKRESRRRSDTLASAASEQVRAIVEAAENSAAEIQREAENDAREIRDEANNEARVTREQASEQAREHVGRVSETTNAMLSRLDAMEQEMNGLIESMRTGANRLSADLQLLENDLSGMSDVVAPRPRFEPEAGEQGYQAEGEAAGGAEAGFGEQPFGEQSFGEQPLGETQELHHVVGDGEGGLGDTGGEGATADFGSVEASAPAGGESDDAEGARLIALNMALNGTPREETERYLSENFQLSDAGGLLDEVYASVEG